MITSLASGPPLGQTQTSGVAVDQHPNVLRAAARVRETFLALQRTELLAPIDGYVAKRSVQLGQRVAAGAPLMSLVALDRVWIEANFKESQLQRLRIGQAVNLQADVYGTKVQYHGRVEGLGAGTGAAFALLPAQNATGNWIKVVQRVPVRITLDAAELVDHPLRVGLSMQAQVDVSKTDGRMLADRVEPAELRQDRVTTHDDKVVDAIVRRVISANGGGSGSAPGALRKLPATPAHGPVSERAALATLDHAGLPGESVPSVRK